MCEFIDFFTSPSWTNLSSGFLGGALASAATFGSIIYQQRKSDTAAAVRKKEDLIGFLDALLEEMRVLWALHMRQTGPRLRDLPDGQPFMWQYPVKDDVFTIYNASAHRVSEVKDSSLRQKIVAVYARSKGLVGGFQLNNHFDEARQKALTHFHLSPNQAAQELYNESLRVMVTYAATLKQAQAEVEQLHNDTVIALETYLNDLKERG